ncbi:MAG: RNA-binding protein [Spirochaetota bacterium]
MANKIYVGNMSYSTTEDSLSEIFSQYGEIVSVNIVKDRYTDQSKGFGFIEMNNAASASAAISALDGYELNGRKLRVNEAENKPRDSRPRRSTNYRY